MYMSFGSPTTIMRTRRESYPSASDGITYTIRPSQERKRRAPAEASIGRAIKLKRVSNSNSKKQSSSFFDLLHEDLLLLIFSALSASTTSRADLVNTMLVCKRFCATATQPQVLAKASSTTLSVTAKGWSDGAQRFLKQCADAGNIEACYTLGMIRFYCLANRQGGASLMAKAAMQSHAAALHSLAVIQFNGSGGTRKDKDLKAGVALCVRAATLGHVDAMRELGHCLQDGYGVTKNPQEGRRLLVEANAREAAAAVFGVPSSCIEASQHLNSTVMRIRQNGPNQSPSGNLCSTETLVSRYGGSRGSPVLEGHRMFKLIQGGSCPLSNDFGCPVPPKLHISNQFMVDWFESRPRPAGLRLCSHRNCGRPETRRHEFRRCSACGTVNYCSRACQALDWKIHHKYDCNPVPDWEERQDQDVEEDDQIAFEDIDES